MRKYLLLFAPLLLVLSGCRTYFGYNSESRTVCLSSLKAQCEADGKRYKEIQKYAKSYFAPIDKNVLEEITQKAEKKYNEKFNYYTLDTNTHEYSQYRDILEKYINEFTHEYRIQRSCKEPHLQESFWTQYPTYDSFRSALLYWEQKNAEYTEIFKSIKKFRLQAPRHVSSVAKKYYLENGTLKGFYLEELMEAQISIEAQKHLYSEKSTYPFPFVVIRFPFDFFGCVIGKWEQAEHKPEFLTRLGYCPPFSWFSFATPPYFTSPAPQETQYQYFASLEPQMVLVKKEQCKVVSRNNIPQAVEWLKIEAQQGNAEAQYNLAQLYDKGVHVEKNTAIALNWYKKAAAQNFHKAEKAVMSFMTAQELYQRGKLLNAKDDPKSFEYLLAAANKGQVKAQMMVGTLCRMGKYTEKNIDDAGKFYKIAAESGNSEAQLLYGIFLSDQEKKQEAIHWYEKSAEQKNATALYLLGLEYVRGRKNIAKGLVYLEQSAELGDCTGQYSLALLYSLGASPAEQFHIHENLPKAIKWCQKSADQGFEDAKKLLPELKVKLERYNKLLKERQEAEKQFSFYANRKNFQIERAKQSVFLLDETRTLEEALSNNLENVKWRTFRSANRTVIEVIGIWKHNTVLPEAENNSEALAFAISGATLANSILPQKGDEVMAQFALTKGEDEGILFFYGEIRDNKGIPKKIKIPMFGEVAVNTTDDKIFKQAGFLSLLYSDANENNN